MKRFQFAYQFRPRERAGSCSGTGFHPSQFLDGTTVNQRDGKPAAQPDDGPAINCLHEVAAEFLERFARCLHARQLRDLAIIRLFVSDQFIACMGESRLDVLDNHIFQQDWSC